MDKPLSEMTNEELWALFPIILREYNPEWPLWYEAEKQIIAEAVGAQNIVRVHHSVPGLTSKPTVDILLEIDRDTGIEALTRALEGAGYITSPQPDNPPHTCCA